MTKLIAQPDSKEKLDALKAVIKVLKVAFAEITSSYNPGFVAQILQSEQDIKHG